MQSESPSPMFPPGAPGGWHQRHFAAPDSEAALSVRAAARLRWWSFGVQAVAVVAVASFLPRSALGALIGLIAIGVASNVLVLRFTRRPSTQVLGAMAVLDAVLLTGLLSLTGGPSNPFSVVYLIYVMLAAMTTNPVWTWATVVTSSAGFGLLFFVSVPVPPELGGHAGHGGQPYAAHLKGMWLAYTLTAVMIARFVGRLALALGREQQIRAQTSRMLGLATLAAGAAHEIGNPLGTIRVAASELERDLGEAGAAPEILRDLALIGDEVRRAHRVLERMSVGAGELLGEGAVATDLHGLLRSTVDGLGAHAGRIDLEGPPAGHTVYWPVQATTQALSQLLRNAVEASPGERAVHVAMQVADSGVQITIADRGQGMSPEILSRIGEPFFTTRPGRGQGLGVFIARSLIEHLGGRVQIESALGRGTIARVWLPAEVGT